MITVKNLSKSYKTRKGRRWVLRDLNFTIEPGKNIGLLGKNGAGKSTLIRLIGGSDYPCKGKVIRDCRVSWPLALSAGYQGSMTGRENARFVSKINGERDYKKIEDFILEFSELGDAFDEPVKTYSSGMRAKFSFGVSLAFDFDVYLVDEITTVGDAGFREKCREVFSEKAKHRQLIMVSHDLSVLREHCSQAMLVRDGGFEWYSDVERAIEEYRGV